MLSSLVLSTTFAAHAVQRSPQATATDNKATAMSKTSQAKTVQVQKATPQQAAASARAAKMLSGPRVLLDAPRTATEARATLRTLPGGMSMIETPESAMNQVILVRGADGKLYRTEGELAPAQQEVSQ